jgi:hypothetical protein
MKARHTAELASKDTIIATMLKDPGEKRKKADLEKATKEQLTPKLKAYHAKELAKLAKPPSQNRPADTNNVTNPSPNQKSRTVKNNFISSTYDPTGSLWDTAATGKAHYPYEREENDVRGLEISSENHDLGGRSFGTGDFVVEKGPLMHETAGGEVAKPQKLKAIREYVMEIEHLLKENSTKDRAAEAAEKADKAQLEKKIADLEHRMSSRIDEMDQKMDDEQGKNDFDMKKTNKRLTVQKGIAKVNAEQIKAILSQMEVLGESLAKLQEEVNGDSGAA